MNLKLQRRLQSLESKQASRFAKPPPGFSAAEYTLIRAVADERLIMSQLGKELETKVYKFLAAKLRAGGNSQGNGLVAYFIRVAKRDPRIKPKVSGKP
jgi:hypothetical protein